MLQWWQPRGCTAQEAMLYRMILWLLPKLQQLQNLRTYKADPQCRVPLPHLVFSCNRTFTVLQWWQRRGYAALVAVEGCAMLQWWQPRGCAAMVAAEGCTVLQWWQQRGCTAQVAAEGCAMLQWW